MSLDNQYRKRKDWRESYRGSKRFDRSCRNHGSCSYCESNRTISLKRVEVDARLAMLAWKDYDLNAGRVRGRAQGFQSRGAEGSTPSATTQFERLNYDN